MELPTLDVLYEESGDQPSFPLPDELASLYGGELGFSEPRFYANFVTSTDGVVAIPSIPGSNRLVSGGSLSDRFVMGLLRACADAVVIGSGTMSASPRSLWTPDQASPPAAAGFAELRRRLGKPPQPEVVVLTASGRIDPAHPSFAAGAVAITSDEGAAKLEGRLPSAATLIPVGPGPELDAPRVVEALHGRGRKLILCEGGPTTIGPFLARRLVDELFLTVAPRLLGRIADDPRLALIEGTDLVPGGPLELRLLSARKESDDLFLRYELLNET